LILLCNKKLKEDNCFPLLPIKFIAWVNFLTINMSEKIKVQNCNTNKMFDADIKHPLFPIRGSGIVTLEDCRQCTDPEEDARLVTNGERTLLFCRTLSCRNHTSEEI